MDLGTSTIDIWKIFWAQTKNLRVRLHLARHHPERVFSLKTRYGSLYFRDNFGDITNLANLFYHPAYPVGVLEGPGVILDVGGNIGLAAAWFAFDCSQLPGCACRGCSAWCRGRQHDHERGSRQCHGSQYSHAMGDISCNLRGHGAG